MKAALCRTEQCYAIRTTPEYIITSGTMAIEWVALRRGAFAVTRAVWAIKETATSSSIQRFTTMLEQQLVELMPELQAVAAVHSIGRRGRSTT
jgi:hypothetical protein